MVCGRLSKILREAQNSVNAQRVLRQKGVWTFRPTESSPHGRFAHVWTFRLMGDSPIDVSTHIHGSKRL